MAVVSVEAWAQVLVAVEAKGEFLKKKKKRKGIKNVTKQRGHRINHIRYFFEDTVYLVVEAVNIQATEKKNFEIR